MEFRAMHRASRSATSAVSYRPARSDNPLTNCVPQAWLHFMFICWKFVTRGMHGSSRLPSIVVALRQHVPLDTLRVRLIEQHVEPVLQNAGRESSGPMAHEPSRMAVDRETRIHAARERGDRQARIADRRQLDFLVGCDGHDGIGAHRPYPPNPHEQIQVSEQRRRYSPFDVDRPGPLHDRKQESDDPRIGPSRDRVTPRLRHFPPQPFDRPIGLDQIGRKTQHAVFRLRRLQDQFRWRHIEPCWHVGPIL